MTKLTSPLPAISVSGWMCAYMHIIAECGMFHPRATTTNGETGSSWTVQRQSQAVENVVVLLEALGQKGRESPLSDPST